MKCLLYLFQLLVLLLGVGYHIGVRTALAVVEDVFGIWTLHELCEIISLHYWGLVWMLNAVLSARLIISLELRFELLHGHKLRILLHFIHGNAIHLGRIIAGSVYHILVVCRIHSLSVESHGTVPSMGVLRISCS